MKINKIHKNSERYSKNKYKNIFQFSLFFSMHRDISPTLSITDLRKIHKHNQVKLFKIKIEDLGSLGKNVFFIFSSGKHFKTK